MNELEKSFKPGEIFQLIKSINEKRERSKIDNVWEIFILPDGTLKSEVRLENGVSAGLFWYGDEIYCSSLSLYADIDQ